MSTARETVAVGEEWDTSKFASRERLLKVVRDSAGEFFELVEAPNHWEVQITPEWQVRDLAGHMVDVIEGYLNAFLIARSGGEPPSPFGLRIMKARLNERARALRSIPREELLKRWGFSVRAGSGRRPPDGVRVRRSILRPDRLRPHTGWHGIRRYRAG